MEKVEDPAPPATPARPVMEALHGVEVADPYRWLEDGESAEVQTWTAEQNAFTRRLLDDRPERPVLRERLLELMQAGFVQAPMLKGARYFYTARSGEANQAILYVRENGADRPLVDPATLRADATVMLSRTCGFSTMTEHHRARLRSRRQGRSMARPAATRRTRCCSPLPRLPTRSRPTATSYRAAVWRC